MNQLLFDLAEQHRQDLLAKAARSQQVMQCHEAKQQSRVHAVLLAWLGERFIAWGWRLRARYGKVEQRPAL